jgi:hypothetical protein
VSPLTEYVYHELTSKALRTRLSLKLTSITEYIPRTLDIDEEQETYGGFGASGDKSYNLGKKRRADEAALRTDAGKRRVIWVRVRLCHLFP